MNKLTTETIRSKIADYVKENEDKISVLFVNTVDVEPAKQAKNWKRMTKRREGPTWVREFDCKPYDDQLRAIVVSNHSDVVVEELYLRGE